MPPRLPPMPTSTTKPSTRSQGSRPPQGRALRTALLAACLVVSAWAGTAPPPLHGNLPPGPREQALRFEDEASQAEAQKDARAEALALRGAAGLYLEQTRLWRTDEGQCAHAAVGLLKRALPLFQEAKDNTGEALCQLDLGEARIAAGQGSEAQKELEAALASFRRTGEKAREASALRHLARAVWTQDPARTDGLLAESLRLAQGLKDLDLEARLHLTLANWRQDGKKDPDGAQRQLEMALHLHRLVGDRAGQAWDLSYQGELFENRKEMAKAEAAWRQALVLWLALPDARQAAALLNSLGSSLVERGAFEEARALLNQGLNLVGGSTAMEDKYRAFLLHNLGLAYANQKDWERARTYYDQSIQVSQATGFLRGEYLTRSNRAVLLGEAGRPQEALEAWLELLKRKVERPSPGGWSEPDIRGEIIDLLVKLKDDAGAVAQAQEARARFKALGAGLDQARFARRLGQLLREKDPDGALRSLQEALDLARTLKDNPAISAALIDLGNLHAAQKRKEPAEACFQEDLALARQAGDRNWEGWALDHLGWLCGRFKESEPALAFYDQAIEVAQSTKNHELERAALKNKSTVLSDDLKRFREALQVDLSLVARCREAKDKVGVCEALIWASADARDIDLGLALRSAQEAWTLALDLHDPEWQAQAGSQLVIHLKVAGRYQDVIQVGDQVLAAAHAASKEWYLAGIEANLGAVHRSLGELDQAIAFGESALKRARALDPKTIKVYLALWELGVSYSKLTRFDKAEALLQEALLGARARQDWYFVGLTLHQLGHLAWAQKRPKEALEDFRQVMDLLSAHLELAPGWDLRCYARLLWGLGRIDEAQTQLERAIADHRSRGVMDGLAYALGDLGGLLEDRGQLSKAEACIRERLKIRLGLQGQDSAIAHARHALGWNLYQQGRYGEARDLLQLASDGFTVLQEPSALAAARKDLGLIHLKLGQVTVGHVECQEGFALGLAWEQGMGLLQFYEDLRDLHHQDGRPLLSAFLGKLAVNAIQDRRMSIDELEEGDQKSFLRGNAKTYQALVDLLIQQDRLSEAQQILAMLKEDELATFGHGEGRVDARTLKATFTGPEDAWAAAFIEHKTRLAALVKALRDQTSKAKLTPLVETEMARQSSLKADLDLALKETVAFLEHLEREALDAPRPAAQMLPRTKALQAKLSQLGHGAVALHYLVLPERIHILLTTPDRLIARTVNLKEADLQKALSDFRTVLQDDWKDPRLEGKALYDLLLAPVETDLAQAGAKTLMLSLDGGLRYIPFAALWDGKRYLVQRWATVMVAEAGQSPAQSVGAPSSRFQGFGLSDQVEGFNALPAVGRELKAISAVLPGPVKLNKAFTRTALEASLVHRPGVLHISSHFLFSPLGSAESFLVLGDGSHFSLRDIDRSPMQFSSLDLLTLSACETGVGGGKEANGLEVESLRARLQMKGAKAVLATLWPVDDDSTGAFMADFYRRWKHTKGETKAEAMRQAQVALIQGRTNGIAAPIRGGASTSEKHDWTHPYYWAPFVLSGDWR